MFARSEQTGKGVIAALEQIYKTVTATHLF